MKRIVISSWTNLAVVVERRRREPTRGEPLPSRANGSNLGALAASALITGFMVSLLASKPIAKRWSAGVQDRAAQR